jgi:hypothetical protein
MLNNVETDIDFLTKYYLGIYDFLGSRNSELTQSTFGGCKGFARDARDVFIAPFAYPLRSREARLALVQFLLE